MENRTALTLAIDQINSMPEIITKQEVINELTALLPIEEKHITAAFKEGVDMTTEGSFYNNYSDYFKQHHNYE